MPFGVLEKVEYDRFPEISGAYWCVGKGIIMKDFLICLVPFCVLERVEV